MQSAAFESGLTRSEQLIEQLRRDIVMGALEGGSRLTEEALAERYGVSRTPVREALRVLARESLLSYTPRSGYTVETIDIETARSATPSCCGRASSRACALASRRRWRRPSAPAPASCAATT